MKELYIGFSVEKMYCVMGTVLSKWLYYWVCLYLYIYIYKHIGFRFAGGDGGNSLSVFVVEKRAKKIEC